VPEVDFFILSFSIGFFDLSKGKSQIVLSAPSLQIVQNFKVVLLDKIVQTNTTFLVINNISLFLIYLFKTKSLLSDEKICY
jgi:hypothetical protein